MNLREVDVDVGRGAIHHEVWPLQTYLRAREQVDKWYGCGVYGAVGVMCAQVDVGYELCVVSVVDVEE